MFVQLQTEERLIDMKNKQFVIFVNHPDRYLYNCFKSKPLVETFETLAQYALTKETK